MNIAIQTDHETTNREQVLLALAYLMTRYMLHPDANTAASVVHHLKLMRRLESIRGAACGYHLYDHLLMGWHGIRIKQEGSRKTPAGNNKTRINGLH